jgi:hypothetical protein
MPIIPTYRFLISICRNHIYRYRNYKHPFARIYEWGIGTDADDKKTKFQSWVETDYGYLKKTDLSKVLAHCRFIDTSTAIAAFAIGYPTILTFGDKMHREVTRPVR